MQTLSKGSIIVTLWTVVTMISKLLGIKLTSIESIYRESAE